MHVRISVNALALALLIAATPMAAQKPESVPVDVGTTSIPKGLKAGDEATTTITFRARQDLERLDVNVAPFHGLQLLSEPSQASFTDVKVGDGRQFTVKVRLTDSNIASLAVHYQVAFGGKSASAAVNIEFANRQ